MDEIKKALSRFIRLLSFHSRAALMIIGEIPGKKEDEIGKPFTGPPGIFLRETFKKSGFDEEDIYFTNVVKHFKFSLINKRKIHRTLL